MNDLMDKTIGQEGSKDHLHLPLHSKTYIRYTVKYNLDINIHNIHKKMKD